MNELDLISQIGNMKEVDYRNTLAIVSMIELLLEKKIISRDDLAKKAKELENLAFLEIEKDPLAGIGNSGSTANNPCL